MNTDMNKFLKKVTKYDLISGLLIFLVIGFIQSFTFALIYLIGISISLINFMISAYMTAKYLGQEGHATKTLIVSFFRVASIIIIAACFVQNTKYITFYVVGLVVHYATLIGCGMK